jgi:phage-related protein
MSPSNLFRDFVYLRFVAFSPEDEMRELHKENETKDAIFVGSSLKELQEFPREVQREIGYALYQAQTGEKHHKNKLLKGFSGVWEIRSDYRTDTYRAVYATKIGARIYVLHCFQKKSKRGIATPQKEINIIKRRLKMARELAQED